MVGIISANNKKIAPTSPHTLSAKLLDAPSTELTKHAHVCETQSVSHARIHNNPFKCNEKHTAILLWMCVN